MSTIVANTSCSNELGGGLRSYYISKMESMAAEVREKTRNLERLKSQRNELNGKVRAMREELLQLHEPASYIGEVVRAMGNGKMLCKVGQDGKYVVDVEADVDATKCTPNTRVALRSDSYALHRVLPTKVDSLVALMKVEKVPDSTYDMVGGLDKQIMEIKEVRALR
jgi:26S proteasome regulatory subunit T6